MDSADSSASWWLHREEPDSPSPPEHSAQRAAVSERSRTQTTRPAVRDIPSIDRSPEVWSRATGATSYAPPSRLTTEPSADFVVHQAGPHSSAEPPALASLPRSLASQVALTAKWTRRCEKWKHRCEKALDDNRVLAEEVQRLRAEAATAVPSSTRAEAVAAPAATDEAPLQRLRERVHVLEQQCEDQQAQLAELTSPTHAVSQLSQEIAHCWPVLEAIADDGAQFTAALQSATQAARSPEVMAVATRLADASHSWQTLHELTTADCPTSLMPSLSRLCDALREERDVLAHLTRTFLTSQAPTALLHASTVADTRLREMEEDHLAEMEESQHIIRDLEKRLAAANSLRRLPWSALAGTGTTTPGKSFPGSGLDSIPPCTPLADERVGSGFLSSATSVVAEGKVSGTEKAEISTQTPVSLEFVMAVAHAVADGTSRSARRSKELDLIDIMAVEMESLRADLENAKSQLAVLLEQRRRFLGQVDAPLEYSTRVGLVRSTGFNVLHYGDTA